MSKLSFSPSGIVIVGSAELVLKTGIHNDSIAWREIKPIIHHMYDSNWFPEKFDRISVMFLYGLKMDMIPRYDRIDKKYKNLGISMELDTHIMRWANTYNYDLLKEIYMISICEGVLHVLKKYKLPSDSVAEERAKYGTIPESVEICEEQYPKIPDGFVKAVYKNYEDPNVLRQMMVDIFNRTAIYSVFKQNLHPCCKEAVLRGIELLLEKSSHHKEQCEEIKAILEKM